MRGTAGTLGGMDARYSIQRARQDAVEHIRALTLRAYAKWLPITPVKPRPMTADYDATIQTHDFDLLYDNGILVGLIETMPQDNALWIENVAIDPAHQGKGLGTLLLHHAERIAMDAGFGATRLCTNRLMTENIALYERLGYRFEKETHHPHGTVAVHMVRPLP